MPLKRQTETIRAQQVNNEYCVSSLDRPAIFALGKEWEDLSRNAYEENPYFSPAYMLALLDNLECNNDIKALAVYKNALLVGFLPYIVDKWHWLGAASVNRAWVNPYITLTIPLVARHQAREVVEALITAMNEQGANGSFWLFDNFNLEGPVGRLFAEVLSDRNLPSKTFDEFDRATLEQGSSFDQHMIDHVSKKRRRDLKRNRRRLGELGRLEMRSFTGGAELESAVDDFLTIEASGWKGQRGTALACKENLAAFARRAFGDNQKKPIARADVLYLDDKPIAVSLAIFTGKTAFTLKCTYDENYRTFSPGLLLEQDIIEDFLKTRWVERLDSATAPGGHVVQGLWNNSIRVGSLLLCADSSKCPENFHYYAQIEKLRRLCRQKLKDIVTKSRSETK